MNELIAQVSRYVEPHLFYASTVWLAAWILTSFTRRGNATLKYWIWVATSVNFILPVSALVGQFLAPPPSLIVPLRAVDAIGIGSPRSAGVIELLWAVWLFGAALMVARLCLRLRVERRNFQSAARQIPYGRTAGLFFYDVPVSFAAGGRGPAVHGFVSPHIVLPDGIDRLLSEPELNAVLIHELTHAWRRDNLIGLIYEVSLCIFWFHPLVWLTGRRMALYRELSCDEAVIHSAHGSYLVSALAKLAVHLAVHEDAFTLYASASAFVRHRLSRLTAGQAQRSSIAANALLTAAFSSVLLAGVLGTGAQTAPNAKPMPEILNRFAIRNNSSSTSAATQAPIDGIKDGIPGGISGGVRGGVPGGVGGGVAGGINGGVGGGVPGPYGVPSPSRVPGPDGAPGGIR